ncbi:hypothetical protein CEXT_92331 [Caerostris extrusa]|uniref:Uncharacterized protein n=1 Tax=Caerostris extrusa TaxID=172846 RepID=A0AAV4NER8_CAEEX|nr:hypothetical protein CEXT_92331 [Caerostris extrusa]
MSANLWQLIGRKGADLSGGIQDILTYATVRREACGINNACRRMPRASPVTLECGFHPSSHLCRCTVDLCTKYD